MTEQLTAKEAKALKKRNVYIRLIVTMFAAAAVLGGVGAFLPDPLQILLWVIAYMLAFFAVMTLFYAFWHQIIALPGSKEFNDKVASGEIVPTSAPVKKRKRSTSENLDA